MADHKKPTSEELKEKMKKSIEDTDDVEEKETSEETPEEEKETPEEEKETPEDSTQEDEVAEEDVEEDKKEDEKEPEEEVEEEPEKPEKKVKKDEPDYKKKFVDSSREGQILYSKNKKMAKAIEKAGNIPEPTDEEMEKEYSDNWEVMSDFEKKMARKELHNSRRLESITEATKEFKEMDKWAKKVDGFVADPENIATYPELDGKEQDFQIFATKPTRTGVDFEDLVSAFLYEEEKNAPPKKKGQMFETGTGGAREKAKPKSDKLDTAESRRLRKTNYKKYLKLLREGKIDDSDI